MVNGAKASFMIDGGAPLPYDAEVEYLENSGTQYIDTGIKVSSSVGIDLTIMVSTAAAGYLFGSRTSAGVEMFYVLAKDNPSASDNGITWYFGTKQGKTGIVISPNLIINFSNVIAHNEMVFGSNTATCTNNTFSSNYNIYLFGMNISGTFYTTSAIMRVYSCLMYNGSTLVRDFIPVRVGQVGYMYDRVSGQLFGNAGTGSFILGNDKNS